MRLLDLFCCEGGAAVGYHRAGFDVTGVDLEPRFSKRYPFDFIQGDALEFVRLNGGDFDAIHASPPCQAYSITKHSHDKSHPDLLAPTRAALIATGKPYVIENVIGAPMVNPVMLCWTMFHPNGSVLDDDGTPLRMERHRLFESNVELGMTPPCIHDPSVQVGGAYGGGSSDRGHAKFVRRGGYTPSKAVRARLLGIEPDHMTLYGLSQCIPPAYTEHVGLALMAHLTQESAA